jgi:4-aminobutyrate aminotransferase-like enzyme
LDCTTLLTGKKESQTMACRIDRRSFLGKSIAAGAAYAGIRSMEEKNLLAAAQDNGKKTRELKKRTQDEP